MTGYALTKDILEQGIYFAQAQFARDEVCLHQGEAAKHIAVITSGKVSAQSYTQDGQKIWVEEFGPNDFLFIESVFSSEPAVCELVAATDASLVLITRDAFISLLGSTDNGTSEILSEISGRIQRQTERLIEANTLSARGRICAELKRHSKVLGVEPDKHIIRPTPVFSEFALRVGSTRESVSRTVSDLTKTGVILRQPGALVISDMGRLEACIR